MAQRWQQRPEGSTWGDFGDDDELGRINLVTPAKVLEGVREVEHGITFCLSLPLDFPGGTALNQRARTCRPPRGPTEDMQGNPEVFYNVPMREMREGDDSFFDVWADDQVTLWLQYSTQWDSLSRTSAPSSTPTATVSSSPCITTGSWRGRPRRSEHPMRLLGDGVGHVCFADHLGLEHMAFHGVQGRGVLVDLVHHLGHDATAVKLETLREIMAADNVWWSRATCSCCTPASPPKSSSGTRNPTR